MRTMLAWLASSLVLVCVGPVALAQCAGPDMVSVAIPFGDQPVRLHAVPVALSAAVNPILTRPLHGDLSVSNGAYYFRARRTFWAVGTDSFTALAPEGSATDTLNVRLLAPTARAWETREDAEDAPVEGEDWELAGSPADGLFLEDAALAGNHGFWVVDSPSGDSFPRVRARDPAHSRR